LLVESELPYIDDVENSYCRRAGHHHHIKVMGTWILIIYLEQMAFKIPENTKIWNTGRGFTGIEQPMLKIKSIDHS